METQYEPAPSQIFLEIARQPKKKYKDTSIQYCQECGMDTEQAVMDKGKDEIYTCPKCGHIHAVRVR